MRIRSRQFPLLSYELSPMSDSTGSIRGQHSVPLFQRRKVKSSATDMSFVPQSTTLGVYYPNALSKLDTISPKRKLSQQRQKMKKKGSPRSTSDPEFQELKGFMDLGFDFRHDKLSPRLLDLLPGLKRLLIDDSINKKIEFRESPLQNWDLPSLEATEVDIKAHLKLWARSVASSLRC